MGRTDVGVRKGSCLATQSHQSKETLSEEMPWTMELPSAHSSKPGNKRKVELGWHSFHLFYLRLMVTLQLIIRYIESSHPLFAISFSIVSVIHSQPWSEKVKWTITEINNSQFLNYVLFWVSRWNLAYPALSHQEHESSFCPESPRCARFWLLVT